jgi:hypothetical protein
MLIKRIKDTQFLYELKNIVSCSLTLYGISVIYQIKNEAFQIYAIEEIYYLVAPILLVWILFNFLSLRKISKLIDVIFVFSIFSFISRFAGEFSLASLSQISFIKSSSPFESDLAQFFFLLFVFYLYTNQKIKVGISFCLTILCFKRVTVLMLFMLFLGMRLIPHNKKVNKLLLSLVTIVFILAPFAVYVMCTDTFADWFYQQFNISFNDFTMTRFFIINTVIDADLMNYGLGTVTHFLENRGEAGQLNMHNDILRIYMECTIIGSAVFTLSYFRIAKGNYFSFIVMFYAFLELFVAHYIGPGSTLFWMIAYLLIFYFNAIENSTSLVGAITRKSMGIKKVKFRFE